MIKVFILQDKIKSSYVPLLYSNLGRIEKRNRLFENKASMGLTAKIFDVKDNIEEVDFLGKNQKKRGPSDGNEMYSCADKDNISKNNYAYGFSESVSCVEKTAEQKPGCRDIDYSQDEKKKPPV